jgi:hypothetical protein
MNKAGTLITSALLTLGFAAGAMAADAPKTATSPVAADTAAAPAAAATAKPPAKSSKTTPRAKAKAKKPTPAPATTK